MTKYLIAALIVTGLASAGLAQRLLKVHQKLGTVEGQRDMAVKVAKQCTEATEELKAQSDAWAKEAKEAVEAARKSSREHQAHANRHLATPPAVPGDDIASARKRIGDWWGSRK